MGFIGNSQNFDFGRSGGEAVREFLPSILFTGSVSYSLSL